MGNKTPSYNHAIHIKGFASGIDFNDRITRLSVKKFLEKIYKHIGKHQNVVIVWDGYDYRPDSFTEIIKELIENADKNVLFVAYKKTSEIPSFEESWAKYLDRIIIKEVPDSLSWDELGLFALRDTDSKKVLTLGGGDTIKKEIANSPKSVKFKIYRVRRIKNGKYEEPCFYRENAVYVSKHGRK
jgi:hypothetical protein